MTAYRWIMLVLYAWIIVMTGASAIVSVGDIVRRGRRGIRPAPLTVYFVALNGCIAAILLLAIGGFVFGADLSWLRVLVMAGVAAVVTYGLQLLLRYRRR